MPRIAITLGDPAGIGPEVIDRALAMAQIPAGVEVIVLGDRQAGTPGQPNERSAKAAWQALDQAVELLKRGEAHAVVTGPVAKSQLQAIGFPFPGQTEFFADAFGVDDYGMLLTGPRLTVGLATIHESLAEVPSLLDGDRIIRIGKLTADFLTRLHPEKQARIAVAGLNPHAGEHGAFGDEETRIIEPAVARLQ